MPITLRSLGLSSLLTILATGCPDNSNTSESADDSTGADTTATDTAEPTSGDTSASDSGNATSLDPQDTDEPPSTDPTTPGDTGDTLTGADDTNDSADDSDSDSESDSDSDGPVDILPQCTALCDLGVECGVFEADPECAVGCSEENTSPDEACQSALDNNLDCLNALTCEQLLAAIQGGTNPCEATDEAVSEVCDGADPVCSVGGGGGPGECEAEIDCDGEPLKQMKCDDETCTCLVDGAEVGTCAADNICDNADATIAKAETCCGF